MYHTRTHSKLPADDPSDSVITESEIVLEPVFDPVAAHGDQPVADAELLDLPQEDRLKLAIKACTDPERHMSINYAAKLYQVTQGTLQNHLKGMKT